MGDKRGRREVVLRATQFRISRDIAGLSCTSHERKSSSPFRDTNTRQRPAGGGYQCRIPVPRRAGQIPADGRPQGFGPARTSPGSRANCGTMRPRTSAVRGPTALASPPCAAGRWPVRPAAPRRPPALHIYGDRCANSWTLRRILRGVSSERRPSSRPRAARIWCAAAPPRSDRATGQVTGSCSWSRQRRTGEDVVEFSGPPRARSDARQVRQNDHHDS